MGLGNDAGLGSGVPGTLDCKGLSDGTKSSAGCDYWAVVPDVILGGNGACFAVFLANTHSEPIVIGVEYDGKPLYTQDFSFIPSGAGAATTYKPLTGGFIPPGEVAILFLNRAPGGFPMPGLNFNCPAGITPAVSNIDAAQHGTGLGKAFHITTSAAVAAYDVYPYGGGQSALTSATLLLPSTSWDTNYVAVDAYGTGLGSGGVVQVVGQTDGTQVTISPANDIVAGTGIAAAKKGQPTSRSRPSARSAASTSAFAIAIATTASRRRRRGASSARSTARRSRGSRALRPARRRRSPSARSPNSAAPEASRCGIHDGRGDAELVNVIHGTSPFGLTVWGWGSGETGSAASGFYSQYVSYAYPGGASVKPINSVVVAPVVR